MGKKNKDEVPNPNSVGNRDIIQRLNFLYQASVYLNDVGTSSAPPDPALKSGKDKGTRPRHRVVSTSDLSRSYIKTMKIVGQKTTVKMDPTVKRTLCKGCNTVLVAGSTASVRVKSSSSHGQAVTYTCMACKAWRRIPAPPTSLAEAEAVSGPSLPTDQDNMPIDPTVSMEPPQGDKQQSRSRNRKKRKKPPTPRQPPLFSRNVGHVVFRGNERLPVNEM